MRPIASRPRYGEWSIVETSIWNGLVASLGGGGTLATIVSNSGVEILQRLVHVHRRRAVARRDVDDRRVELRGVGLELDEQVEHFVVHAQSDRRRADRSC